MRHSSFRAWYRRRGKRMLDFGLSSSALLALSPLAICLALLIRQRLGSPVLFRQKRPGLGGRPFEILKFRTMTDARGPTGEMLSDRERLTPFGSFLRSASLDEIPELFNVFRGEMSLVGPRPLLMRYYPYFRTEELVRFSVRPGITGSAQVSGRNDLSWDSRIRADLEYAERHSLSLDLKILLRTLAKVLTRDGIQVDPEATMLNFDEERRRQGMHPGSDAGLEETER